MAPSASSPAAPLPPEESSSLFLEIGGEEGAGLVPGIGGGGPLVTAAGRIGEGVVRVVRMEFVLHPCLREGRVERLHLVGGGPAVLAGPCARAPAPQPLAAVHN